MSLRNDIVSSLYSILAEDMWYGYMIDSKLPYSDPSTISHIPPEIKNKVNDFVEQLELINKEDLVDIFNKADISIDDFSRKLIISALYDANFRVFEDNNIEIPHIKMHHGEIFSLRPKKQVNKKKVVLNMLVELSNELDKIGLIKFANCVDNLIKKSVLDEGYCTKCNDDKYYYKKITDDYDNIHYVKTKCDQCIDTKQYMVDNVVDRAKNNLNTKIKIIFNDDHTLSTTLIDIIMHLLSSESKNIGISFIDDIISLNTIDNNILFTKEELSDLYEYIFDNIPKFDPNFRLDDKKFEKVKYDVIELFK